MIIFIQRICNQIIILLTFDRVFTMRFTVRIFRILFLFLMLAQALRLGYRESFPANDISHFAVVSNPAPDASILPEVDSELYSPETLQLPDALLSPIPSFQFGLVEILACFLFVLFTFCLVKQIRVRNTFFTNSYLHTLFLSVILINAP